MIIVIYSRKRTGSSACPDEHRGKVEQRPEKSGCDAGSEKSLIIYQKDR
jgi:hypothetical protein